MTDLSAEERRHTGLRIDRERRNQGLSFVTLAERTGYDERTIRNVVKGLPTRPATLSEICQALNIDVHGNPEPQSNQFVADEAHGSYSFSQCEDYIGHYYATRRSFSARNHLVRSIFDIFWSDSKRCLCFHEHQRFAAKNGRAVDYSQQGEVFVSKLSGLIHLQTMVDGSIRLITLTRLRMDDQTMNGVVLTQAPQTFYFKPSLSPIFLQKTDSSYTLDELASEVRSITPQEEDFHHANEYLLEIERNIGLFALGLHSA
uniref:XRE family transcriptional regulator n=1 Tax=Agrobacterium albertimagni TaxID=147266 RepID=A0A7C1NYF7_9HYPH